MIEPAVVRQLRTLAEQGWGSKRIAAELGLEGTAEGNAVVVARLLRDGGMWVGVRTVQRLVEGRRRELRAVQVATVRFETAPGHQMQVDVGQKLVAIAGELVRIYLLVAVLSYSRRLFVKAFLAERQDDWREGAVYLETAATALTRPGFRRPTAGGRG